MINQIESNPYFNNQELIDYYHNVDIAVEVWSPLGGNGTKILLDPQLIEIAQKYNKCAAQIIIRWDIQRNVVVLPKSTNTGRIKANYDVFDFELTSAEMKKIDALNKNIRTGSDPETFDF